MEGGKIRWSIKEVDLIINNNHRERERERENRTVAILVEQAESFLELRDLVVGERERESDRRHPCRTSWKLPWTQRSGRRWVGLPFSILSFQKKKNLAFFFLFLFVFWFSFLREKKRYHMRYLFVGLPCLCFKLFVGLPFNFLSFKFAMFVFCWSCFCWVLNLLFLLGLVFISVFNFFI